MINWIKIQINCSKYYILWFEIFPQPLFPGVNIFLGSKDTFESRLFPLDRNGVCSSSTPKQGLAQVQSFVCLINQLLTIILLRWLIYVTIKERWKDNKKLLQSYLRIRMNKLKDVVYKTCNKCWIHMLHRSMSYTSSVDAKK